MSKSWEQLLGGYATNTLTEEEKRVLFEAALEDQTVFDALADEEALRELLANPEARQRILESLQASGGPPTIAETHTPRLRWYRQPSSLAWAGSMAAMGLALLFGWQMEAIWGPEVQETLQAEREISREKDDVALRSQPSRVEVKEPPMPEGKNKIQPETDEAPSPSEVTAPPPPIPTQKPSVMEKAPKLSEESPSKVLADRIPKPVAKKEMVAKAPARKRQVLKSTMAEPVPQESQSMAGSMEDATIKQDGIQQLPQTQTFADRMPQQDTPSSMGTRDLSSSETGSPPAEDQIVMRENRADRLFGGMSADTEKAFQESASVEKRQQASSGAAMTPSRGIRYRFIQVTSDGEKFPIEIDQLPRNWANLQLGITSTIPGYLYVMTEIKKGNWQWLKTETLNLPRSSDGAINVMPNETVVFSFGPIPHDLGRPFISSVAVLLSTTPILDLRTWLGIDQHQDQIHQALDKDILVTERNPNPQEPFRVHIPLGQ